MSSLRNSLTQFFPPKPQFTANNIPSDLQGKVYFITGANSGMGYELARTLYAKNAKVYLACRSEEKATEAITSIKKTAPRSNGELIFLSLDLADLAKVKAAASKFLGGEDKLHVLFNNAGVMPGPSSPAPKTAQDHELSLGVNCIGAFLLTTLLTPLLLSTIPSSPPSTVRVIWLSSFGLQQYAPPSQGLDLGNLTYAIQKPGIERYGLSKCGVWLLAVEYARRYGKLGLVSVPVNPGNVKTQLARDQSVVLKCVVNAVVYSVRYGVCSQLFAAFSDDVTVQKTDWSKDWIIPWGRFAPLRPDLTKATKPEEEGGNGNAQKFWEWNEEQVKEFL